MITKGRVFESKYDMGDKFEERLKLSRVTGHDQIRQAISKCTGIRRSENIRKMGFRISLDRSRKDKVN